MAKQERKPRHSQLAEQLGALLAYRSRPEGEPIVAKSNWTTVVANDNDPEDMVDMHVERRLRIRPSVGEIVRELRNVEMRVVPLADIDVPKGEHSTYLAPTGGDVDTDDAGRVVRIGGLCFSDGEQTERAFTYGADGKLIAYDARVPLGGMLRTSERQERVLGGDVVVSNRNYTDVYKARHAAGATRRKRDNGEPAPVKTKDEMRAEIAAATAQTKNMPVVKVGVKGFPWKPSNLRELFLGLEKGRKGESGAVAWEDICTHIVEREVWAGALAAVSPGDKTALDAAMTASSMAEVAPGGHKKAAMRRGKRVLIAANDNFLGAYKKSA